MAADNMHGCCPRMVHTTEEVSAAALANKDRLKIQKTARDFVMRVTSISGISSAACVPDGGLCRTRISCLNCLPAHMVQQIAAHLAGIFTAYPSCFQDYTKD